MKFSPEQLHQGKWKEGGSKRKKVRGEFKKEKNLLTKQKREWEKVEKGGQEDKEKKQKKMHRSEYQGTSLVVQCLGLLECNAGGLGLTPESRTKIPHAATKILHAAEEN